MTKEEKLILLKDDKMQKIRTEKMVFEDYYFNMSNMTVVSVKKDSIIVIKPIRDRKKPTWKLYQNGQYYLVSLAEIIRFTIQKNNGADTQQT